jgi:hypothetical protein
VNSGKRLGFRDSEMPVKTERQKAWVVFSETCREKRQDIGLYEC